MGRRGDINAGKWGRVSRTQPCGRASKTWVGRPSYESWQESGCREEGRANVALTWRSMLVASGKQYNKRGLSVHGA